MDNRSGLIIFGIFILLFGFSFVFCLDALRLQNVEYGVLALVGFLVCVFGGLMNGIFLKKDGGALAIYYFAFVILASIGTVWYMTRCGTAFGWWT